MSNKTGFPYTPLICLFGLIMGLIPAFGELKIMTDFWSKLSPQLMMLIFLPPLIFESAFSTDYHTFKKQLGKILLMAIPIILAATFLTALVMYYILGY